MLLIAYQTRRLVALMTLNAIYLAHMSIVMVDVSAISIEDLANEIDVPSDELKKSVASFNKAVDGGELSKLTPPNFYKKPQKIEKSPFYASPFSGGMTATFDGRLINSRAEVQNLERKSIPGLFATSNAAGGLFFRD